ncbi:hypothetical protein KY290_033610 [Solanum tuberosum]|uniref:Uncharacterized protein n=1 Tax=Solanum tuberosum TaxID=4113 RepID=A0ABQ7U2P3_SOLTU|nr:hypothetical protein KY289_032978 [Solanum tuberosum]KAH0647619.1 hypothetical protein KY285_032867 [Solanum tuberosum]KAH0740567.1 hypothetical protein KY290_033610 [Solanum tuberosum]
MLTARCYVERAYKYKTVKVLEFLTPHQQCVVHLDLDRCECSFLFPTGKVFSRTFHLGGRELFLAAYCNMDLQGAVQCLGLFLGMHGKESKPLAIYYEFAVRMSPTNEYVSKHKGNYTLTSGVVVGCRNLCCVDWTAFLKEDSLYFIKGVVYLLAVITIRE